MTNTKQIASGLSSGRKAACVSSRPVTQHSPKLLHTDAEKTLLKENEQNLDVRVRENKRWGRSVNGLSC